MKKILPYLLLFVFAGANAQKYKLLLNLKTGETYHHTGAATLTLIETINGKELNISSTITGTLTFKVTSVKDSLFYTDAQYTDIGMKIGMGGQEMAFQSNAKDKTDLMSQMLSQMTNKTFQVVFSKTGRINAVEGIKNLITGIFDKFPNVSEAQKAQVSTQLMQSFGDESFRSNIEMASVIFPDKPVEKSAAWTIHTRLSSKITADVLSNYHLVDVTDSYYAIHDDAKITTQKSDKFADVGGMKVKYEMDGTMTSDIKVNKFTGWIIETKMTQAIKGNAMIQDNPQVPGGMTMPMTINSQITTTGN